jgi:hypothetical protein
MSPRTTARAARAVPQTAVPGTGVEGGSSPTPSAPGHGAHDSLWLASVVVLSAAPYLARLGFYYDDWAILGLMRTAEEPTFLGLLRAVHPLFPNRSVHGFYSVMLYRLFGDHPLGYHLANLAVFLAGVLLLHLSLRALGVNRPLALALPVVYALLPNYSTDRFWFATFNANLSLTLFCAALYAEIRAVRSQALHRWRALSFAAFLVSSFTYEVFLCLFPLIPAFVWLLTERPEARVARFPWAACLTVAVALVVVLSFKALTTTRLGAARELTVPEHLVRIVWLFRGALSQNYLQYGLGLPQVFWRILTHHWSAAVTLTGLATGGLVFVQLYRALPVPTSARHVRGAATLAAGGVGLLILGYAPFLLNYNLAFTPTGVGNRTAIAGALGVAVSLVGIVAAASAVSGSSRTRRLVFATTIAALCAMGSTVTSTIASFWARAYAAERTILQGLRDSLPAIPAGGTVLLDGMCSHVGPAVVFLMDWDATGALRVLYEVRDVRGDVVLPYTQVTETGITIHHTYPYRQLYVYNHTHRVVLELTSVTAARRYFERFNSDYTNGCPPFGGESGVPIF